MDPYALGAYWADRHKSWAEQWESAPQETKDKWIAESKLKRICKICSRMFRVTSPDAVATQCPCCQTDHDIRLQKLAMEQVDLEEAIEAERQRRKEKKP